MLCQVQQVLNEKLETEENYWKQRANVKWLTEGDRNTHFFHQSVKNRRQKLHLHRLKNSNGQWIATAAEIEKEAVEAFQSQLNGNFASQVDTLLNSIPPYKY